jgi:proteasome lid subunit RPN8/RPN11
LAVLEAFYAFPRGGAEIGGVLFGTRRDGVVHLHSWRDLNCEHAFGPSFALSENDRTRLEQMLTPDVVGWFHSHTRSDIFLSEQDLEIHRRHFPEPWHVALVLRPSFSGTRAGFFACDAEGKLRAGASYAEFSLAPLSGRVLARAPNPAPAAAAHPPAAAPQEEPAPAPRPVAQTLPSFALPEPRRLSFWPVALVFLTLLSSICIYATRDYWLGLLWPARRAVAAVPAAPVRPEPVRLEAVDSGGQMQIRWNRNAGALQDARSATLDIRDGEAFTMVTLPPDRLRSGAITYVRQTERVEVRLDVEAPGGRKVTEFATFEGAPPQPAAEPVPGVQQLLDQREQLQQQLREARTEIVNQALLIKRLQDRVRALQAARPAPPPPPSPETAPAPPPAAPSP